MLGSLLAHEFTHQIIGLTDKFYNGKSADYWTPETKKSFKRKMNCLVDAYEKEDIQIIGKKFKERINGTSTLHENFADLWALNLAYKGLKNTTSQEEPYEYPESVKKFTPEQLFFLSYANVHCSSDSGKVANDLYLGVHSPRKYRVNVPLKHMPEFAQAFQCKAGSKMNPKDKCSFV